MENKSELIRIAGELKSLADRLLDCCKESEEDDDEDDYGSVKKDSKSPAMLAVMLKEKMDKKK